jgi:hypothetical protein
MKRGTSGVVLLLALAFPAREARADLLVQTGDGPTGYRGTAEAEQAQARAALEASLLFFPPLSALKDPDDSSNNQNPPGPPGAPRDPQPGDPPHHNPEPASLVTGVVGGGLVCLFGWWRRRPDPLAVS